MTVVQDMDGFVEEYARAVPVKPVPVVTTVDEAMQRLREERLQTAYRLGLTSVASPRPVRRSASAAAEFYPEWSGLGLRIWRAYLPQHYSRNGQWRSYQFDEPPLRALKAIEAAVSADVFDRLEIWTPEGRRSRKQRRQARWVALMTDPIAVGLVGVGDETRYFPIVRWGSEELVSEWTVFWSWLRGNR